MKQCVLDHLTHEFGKIGRSIGQGFNKADTDADLYVTAEGGKLVAIHIAADVDELPNIKGRYEQNTLKRIHTLFIVNGDLLPKDQNAIEPDYWMALLHTLSHGRIYAYYCEEDGVTIRPIHMDWKWGGGPRTIEYGQPINIGHLHTETVNCTSKYVVGAFASAGFGEGAFWKKRQPGDEREFKFSWRNWSYSTGKKQTTPDPEEREASWDPWEEFNQTYGDASEQANWSEQTFGGGSARRERTRQAPPRRVAPVVLPRYYSILGVSASATFEEVKQAYRRKARQYHPDLHPNEKEKYTAKMADINAAFEALSKHLKAQ